MDGGKEVEAYGQTDGQTKGSVAQFGGRVLLVCCRLFLFMARDTAISKGWDGKKK